MNGIKFAQLSIVPTLVSWVLITVIASLQAGEESAFERLGDQDAHDSLLLFGGSLSPPTLEHMSLCTRIANRFGFSKAKFLPTFPYKKGAAPAEVSLHLTQIAVQNLDEILELNNIPYENLKKLSASKIEYLNRFGHKMSVEVDDHDIRTKNKENTLQTLESMRLESSHQDPKQLFWISGSDSFLSVPSWTSDWKKLFQATNWIVVSRPGISKDGKEIDFYKDNPLKGLFPENFLNEYQYQFHPENRIHEYQNKNKSQPSIYIVEQPLVDDSSSKNRESLRTPGDHSHAQGGLQPSVFIESVRQQYYSENKSHDYELFSRQNLELYLNHISRKIEWARSTSDIRPEHQSEFITLSAILLSLIEKETAIRKSESRFKKLGRLVRDKVSSLTQLISDIGQPKRLIEKMRNWDRKYQIKWLMISLLIGNLMEFTIIPGLLSLWYGPKGLLFSPAVQTEVPIFLVWGLHRLFSTISQRIKYAGSIERYRQLSSYRSKLLRGDPSLILTRFEAFSRIGLYADSVPINIIKSEMPYWIPLWLRRWNDKRTVWHDINISTNELRAILNNQKLYDQLYESSKDSFGIPNLNLFSNLLLSAILKLPEKKYLLEYFVAYRHFKHLWIGDIPHELLPGFSEAEQKAIQELSSVSQAMKHSFVGNDLQKLKGLIAHLFSVYRLISQYRSIELNEGLWTSIIDTYLSKYPNQKPSILNLEKKRQLHLLITALAEILPLLVDSRKLKGTKIIYHGQELLDFDLSNPRSLDANDARLLIAIKDYILKFKDIFRKISAEEFDTSYKLIPTLSRGEDIHDNNLNWEIEKYHHHISRRLESSSNSFENAFKKLDNRPHDTRVRPYFQKEMRSLTRDLLADQKSLRMLQFEWLKIRQLHDNGIVPVIETHLPGFLEVSNKFQNIRRSTREKFEKMRRMTAILLNVEGADLKDMKSIQKRLCMQELIQFSEKTEN